jgi:adenine-specific DNA-methyltransferase
MTLTDHQAKYFAHELTLRHPPDSLERLAGAVGGTQVDLNPHQVDAASSHSTCRCREARCWRTKWA